VRETHAASKKRENRPTSFVHRTRSNIQHKYVRNKQVTAGCGGRGTERAHAREAYVRFGTINPVQDYRTLGNCGRNVGIRFVFVPCSRSRKQSDSQRDE